MIDKKIGLARSFKNKFVPFLFSVDCENLIKLPQLFLQQNVFFLVILRNLTVGAQYFVDSLANLRANTPIQVFNLTPIFLFGITQLYIVLSVSACLLL